FSLKSNPGARESFELLRELKPDDIEADQRLATLYQRLGDYARSGQAVQRVIGSALADRSQRGEALTLHGHIIRTRWLESFAGRSGDDARQAALCSPALDEALKGYTEAFQQDLNQPYPGLVALGLLCTHNALAQALPGPWADQFDSDEEAARELAASV